MITTKDVPSGEVHTFTSRAACDRFLQVTRPGVLWVEIDEPGFVRQLMGYGQNFPVGCPCQFVKEAAA